MKPLRSIVTVLALSTLLVPLSADANVRREGNWPASEKKIDLEFDGAPSKGLEELADEAGWSIVVSKAVDLGSSDVKINVDDQPADAVLEALFADNDVVARRNGSLITITPAAHGAAPVPAPEPPVPPVPPVPAAAAAVPAVPPVPTVRGEDRDVFGNSTTIGKDEIVHSLTVTGGSAVVYGIVTGDLAVMGGSAKLAKGSRVVGDATIFGGSLTMDDGARIDGDVGVVGGSLKRADGAVIGGKLDEAGAGKRGSHGSHGSHDNHEARSEDSRRSSGRSRLSEAAESFGHTLTNMSLLFVLGCVLLALGTRRMDVLRTEVASRPMRSFAMGIVGLLGAVVGVAALCLTIVGIPFALLGVIVGVFAVYASLCSVLVTFGAAVSGHKTKNPYLHLLVGVLAFLVLGSIPYLGDLVTFALVMTAIGSLVSTRLAGIIVRRTPKPAMV